MISSIKRIGFLVFILLIVLSNLPAQSYKRYLTAAQQTANWLTSLQRVESSCEGLSWPASLVSTTGYTGLDQGAAGIGMFFLKLYGSTKNPSYLDEAEGASRYIADEYRRGNTYGPDWLSGAASGGNFFLAMYEETHDTVYLNRARIAADWLIRNALTEESGYHWSHGIPKLYTGIAHGAAGIGLFFLGMYEKTADTTFLRFAEGAFTWIEQYSIRFDETSIGWKRLTDDADAYNLWCGGSTGIIFFLEKLHSVTNKEVYSECLRQTANGLIKFAVNTGGGYAWPYNPHGASLPVIYCHGTASTAHALYAAYALFHDEKYRNCAHKGTDWIKNVHQQLNESCFYWPHIYAWGQYDTGLMTGTASIGHAFVQYYQYEKDSTFLRYAISAADDLLSVAEKPTSTQMRWINYTNTEDLSYDVKTYYTGWYSGAAGIGIFLTELFDLLQSINYQDGDQPPIPTDFVTVGNFPNPFNSGTSIVFTIPSNASVSMEILDISGKRLRTMFRDRMYSSGTYIEGWNGRNEAGDPVASGAYFVRVRSDFGTQTHKVTLLK